MCSSCSVYSTLIALFFLIQLVIFNGKDAIDFWMAPKNTYFEEHLRTTASKLLFREKPHWLNKMRFIDIANTFHKDRSSRPKLFCKNVVFKKFTKFTIKQLCRSLVLKKETRLTVINERLLHRYFSVSFTKLLRIPIDTYLHLLTPIDTFLRTSIFFTNHKLLQLIANTSVRFAA